MVQIVKSQKDEEGILAEYVVENGENYLRNKRYYIRGLIKWGVEQIYRKRARYVIIREKSYKHRKKTIINIMLLNRIEDTVSNLKFTVYVLRQKFLGK